jgi:hypothetical protein
MDHREPELKRGAGRSKNLAFYATWIAKSVGSALRDGRFSAPFGFFAMTAASSVISVPIANTHSSPSF